MKETCLTKVGEKNVYTHLHIQSGYSLLTSTVKITELVAKAKADGCTSLALTDRNVMYGSVYFYKECKRQGIKPIIGILADVLDEWEAAHGLLLLAKNLQGYQNLLKISSAIKTKSPSGIPMNWLKGYSKGLIAITPGAGGEIETLLKEERPEEAQQAARKFQQIFGADNFYASIQRLSIANEEEGNEAISLLAKELGIKVVATNPVYYLNESDALAQEVLLAIGNGDKLADEAHTVLESKQYYLKSRKQMAELFHDRPDALENTLVIAGQCNLDIPFHRSLLPKYPTEAGMTAEEMLEAVCFDGLKKRLPEPPIQYEERLRYELDVITKMKFSDYFLIVWDFMKFAKDQQILTGPGRGSAAGSMVAYVLSITDVDPIEHSLLFERFLNPERVSMPDIDIDFPDNRREEVIAYVAKKYGEYHVAQIITFGTLAAKAALRDTGRVFGLNSKEQEAVSKMIPNRLGITLPEAFKESKRLRDFVNESNLNQKLFQTALLLEGLPRHTSTHAAGIVISDQALTEHIPISGGHEGIHLTQYPMDLLEELGLLKMDFLGLRNLTLIDNIIKNIQKGTGRKLDLSQIPMDDPETLALLGRGETTGVFQFESDGIRKVLVKLKPNRFEDIVAVNALYRPGPMENIPLFIERKHGLAPIDYLHEDLRDILEPTYGVIVYQEQIMQIASRLAGFSLGEADLLRRAVSKKKKDVLDEERQHFVSGALQQGYSEKTADEIYSLIVRFANYGFNRSHAVAYSVIAYQLGYLKTHYPEYFMAALMTSVIGNDEKVAQYIREAKKKGIAVLAPSINRSGYPFIPEKEGIRFSLGAIKGIGGTVLKEIFAARRQKKFEDLFDFCLRVSGKIVNRKVLEALVNSGAFDEFGEDRATLLASLDVAISHTELVNPDDDLFDMFSDGEFSLKPKYNHVDPIPIEDKLALEKNALGLYLSNHPVTGYRELFQYFGCLSIDEATNKKESKILLGAYITSVKTIRTKKGDVMAFLSVSDEEGDIEAVAFPNVYKLHSAELSHGQVIMLQGTLEERDGKNQLLIKSVYPLEKVKQMKEEKNGTIFLKVEADKQTNDTLQKIKKILLQHGGETKVMLFYERENRYVQLSYWDWVNPTDSLLQALIDMVGKGNVVYKKE
ncbi:DNA polymerase III [Peribacillus simplex]|uniref:DNA polymerase III subunit alpha n=1 Tax=Peribacillus simplex TaxID=1478 RepID=A0A109MYM2_9BACI|nr:DNA polymerase III [Peribacillus simplex]